MTEIQRAMSLIRQGNKKEAQPILEGLIRSDPQDVMSWFWYAETLGSTHTRVKLLEVCLKHNPGNPQVIRALRLLRVQLPSVRPPPSMSSQAESFPSTPVKHEEPAGAINVLVGDESSIGASVSDEDLTNPLPPGPAFEERVRSFFPLAVLVVVCMLMFILWNVFNYYVNLLR